VREGHSGAWWKRPCVVRCKRGVRRLVNDVADRFLRTARMMLGRSFSASRERERVTDAHSTEDVPQLGGQRGGEDRHEGLDDSFVGTRPMEPVVDEDAAGAEITPFIALSGTATLFVPF